MSYQRHNGAFEKETSKNPAPKERRFYLQMANECDLFLSAPLTGQEPDFLNRIRQVLNVRHDGALDHVEIVNVIAVG